MPGLDGTGPRGAGSMTGGGRGYCAVHLNGEDAGRGSGRLGLGRRMGRGRGNCFRVLRDEQSIDQRKKAI